MFSRSAQWTSVLILVVCVALLVGGCFGGGGDSDTTTQTTGTVPTGSVGTGDGPGEGSVLEATADDPADFANALGSRPIVILFYIPGNADDTKVLDTVNKLRTAFNSYTFLLYDYKNPEAYGALAQELKVEYTPYVALIDATGVLQKVFVGFVDEGSLNQTLVNLGR